jgi:hypothetical protein
LSHKDRRQQRERKEQMRNIGGVGKGTCVLCKKRNPTSNKCPESPNGHIILEAE